VGLRWALTLLVLGLAACNGGGYNASGTWEGVATNRNYPYDAVTVRFILHDQGGVLSGSHYALLDVGWVDVRRGSPGYPLGPGGQLARGRS